ncbi:MAG: hypothetical protein AAF318_03235 [Pseudomonadota bacterium]
MRLIVIAALATALSIPAVAQTNTFTSVQDGRNNSAAFGQQGDDNLATSVQRGRNNRVVGVQCTNDRFGVNDGSAGQTSRGRGRNQVTVVQGRC